MNLGSQPAAVLVVDGDELVRMVTTDMLSDAGFDTVEARTAAEALAVLDGRTAVGLLITGRSLPGSDSGIQLCHQVRARWPSLGIIVTAGTAVDLRRELPPGVRLIRKPFDFAVLVRAVEAEIGAGDETASAQPLVPDGIPLQAGTQLGGGAGALAAPATEPDKS